MTFQTPWITAGMAEVPLELARVLAYVASGGVEGIVSPTDLRVRQLATAGTSVRIAAGAFSTYSRFSNQANQAYIGYSNAEVQVAVPANNTASIRYDLVYAHVTDPGQVGQPGPNAVPVDVRVLTNVSSTATTLSDVPGSSTQTGYVLARLAIPANTSTITSSMITDLRALVNQRRQEEQRILSYPTGTAAENLTTTSFSVWPNSATWPITIPKWATNVQITGHISGYKMIEAGTAGANFNGLLDVQFGTLVGPSTTYNYSLPAGLGQADAGGSMVVAEHYLDTTLRGTTVNMRLRGLRTGGTTGANLQATAGTVVVFRALFVERPDLGA